VEVSERDERDTDNAGLPAALVTSPVLPLLFNLAHGDVGRLPITET
jgi:hypothetical protein